MLIDHAVLVDVKAVTAFTEVHRAQCLNYLKASGPALLLINFGRPRVQIKRLSLSTADAYPCACVCICGFKTFFE